MKKLAFLLSVLLSAGAVFAAGGAASLVAKESKTKDFNYSFNLKIRFLEECTQSANKQVCECVLRKIQKQYSEAEYLKFDAALRKNIDCPEFTSYISSAVKTCDSEYSSSYNNYSLKESAAFARDIDKVLREVADLQTMGMTVPGDRRSRVDRDFDEGYAEGGSEGVGDDFSPLLMGGIATKAKGSIKTPSERDIKMDNGGSRSAAEIMKVVRQRTPGLRQIYNKFLKKKPGFQGKVTLKLMIAPDGEISSISIVSSTTGYKEFDKEIKKAVSRWKFSKVESGETTVTIPFTFSE